MKNKVVWYCFFSLVILGLLSPLWTFSVLFFPYITSKAFYFRVVVLLLAPFYFYLIYSDQKLRPNLKAPINLAVIGFVVVNLIAALAGVNVSRSLWGNFERMGGVWYLMHLTALYFYVLVIGQAGIKYLKIFLQLFLGVTAVLVINGIFGKLGWATFTLDPSLPERVSSTFGNPIFFASYLIIPLFISLYLIVNERAMLQKRLYIFSAFLSLIGIYLSATRGALVGILASAVVFVLLYVFFSESSKAKKFGIFSLGAVIAFFALLIFISPKFSEESAVRRLISLNDSNSKARLIQWQMAFQGFKERPILGVGPENYYVIFNEFYNTEMYKYDASWFD
jgi:O-antigen ligase